MLIGFVDEAEKTGMDAWQRHYFTVAPAMSLFTCITEIIAKQDKMQSLLLCLHWFFSFGLSSLVLSSLLHPPVSSLSPTPVTPLSNFSPSCAFSPVLPVR